VLDAMCDLVGANASARQLLGIDERGLRGVDRNFLAILASERFRATIPNWFDVAVAIFPDALSPYLEVLERGSRVTHLRAVARAIRDRHPGDAPALERILDALGYRDDCELKVRSVFPLTVSTSNGPLNFNAVMAPWSAWDSKWAIDLHPADAETWEAIARC
jgi:hypothetical protein